MHKKILLLGAGQLGSRYLQGLVLAKSILEITVVDLSSDSLQTGKSRWIEAGGDESPHQVCWVESLPSDLQKVDIALIVTSSKGRANLIDKIAKAIDVRHWVLEKVLAQSSDELRVIQSALAGCEGAWVNTPRRMMAWHRSLKEAFAGRGPLKMICLGGLWGLACNSIHYIDLLSWWSGEPLVSVDTSGLDHHWHESKRAEYFEIMGELVTHFSAGTSLRLNSKDGAQAPLIKVGLSDGVIWEIDESAGTAHSSNGERVDGRPEFQSQMSGRLVDDILQRGECDLPSFDESASLHAIFLDGMLSHWNHSQNRNDDLVPIT
ncbi:hypothetical protein OAR11_00105 [Alphaproteobacteria bacterium]|nr:hypothetical protein [Alphaproteobacteria bacterium]